MASALSYRHATFTALGQPADQESMAKAELDQTFVAFGCERSTQPPR
jgi:hypothetical protein